MSDETPALLPCPFCGDPMLRWGHGEVVHSLEGRKCIIGGNGFFENAWNTRAAPRVKPLDWQRIPRGVRYEAKTSIGRYTVERNDAGFGLWTPDQSDDAAGYFASDDLAKAVARADFTARIRAAIDMGETE